MSDLHPTARALINAAKRGEGSLPSEARARVHRSVLRRAVAVGAAVATTSTASAVSKAAALVAAGLTSPFAIPGVLGAVAGVALLVLRASTPSTSPPAPRTDLAAATHAIAPSMPRALPPGGSTQPIEATHAVEATQGLALPAPAASLLEPASAGSANASPMGIPGARALALPARPAAIPARGTPTTPAAALPEEPAAEAIESAPVRTLEDGSRTPVAVATPTSKAATAVSAVDLASDLELLRQVHADLGARRSGAALALLEHAGKELDFGPLAEEAQLARVSALCQLGRSVDARAAADRFLAAWPSSPLAARMRGGCAGIGTNSKPGAD
jgi:hypothetical protein